MSALGEMAAGLAHQLRNSLGAMVGFNTLVKKRLQQQQVDVGMVENIEIELKESENLIKRFLHFTKPFDFSPDIQNLLNFTQKIVETISIRNDFADIHINIKNNLHQNIEVYIDSLLLKQALTNILENSKKSYMQTSGKIDIILNQFENESCTLSIKDYGCGIEKENISKIFTPFYSTDPSGTGLGLPLAQKIIALHQGNLQIESEVGQGTTFILSLPIIHQEAPINS